MPLAPQTHLGPYVILSPLGAGGMGEVYRAHDDRLDRDVAVKVLPRHLCQEPAAMARFRDEARAVAALAHPNVLVLHDVGSEGDVCFVVTELLEGETLGARLARSPLPWRKAAELGAALADGLSAAHAKGIVHRDVKPANIFLTTAGQVKILDFGLARRAPANPTREETVAYEPGATESISICGTVPYMSPEQVIGSAADARSDLFSLGCVLYEMVSGRRAFARPSQTETLAAILHEDPAPLAPGKDVPPELERVVRHCLEKNPEERFQSARDLAFALRALLGEVAAPPAPRPSPPGTRPRLPARAAWAAAALLLVASAAALYFHGRGGPPPPPAIEAVAVLPFVNEAGDAGSDYLSDGMADSLVRNLSQVRTLKVRPFASALRYKGKEADVPAVGQALKVQAVVLGRVRRRGDELSVSVELVDAADNRVLWAGQYRRRLHALVALQEEMSQEIADHLRHDLSGEDRRRVVRRYTASSEAYRLYLLGRFHWNKRTKAGLTKALEFYRLAIDRDGRFALAYAGLADCYSLLPGYGYTDRPARESFAEARAMAAKALALDDTLAEAHTALAYVRLHEWDWPGAEAEFRRALRANPNYATAHHWYACYLAAVGRHEEALAEIRRAQALDPSSLIINGWVAVILCYGNRVEEAVDQARDVVQMEPGFAVSHFFLGIAYRRKGMPAEAVAEFEKAVELDRDSVTYLTGLGEAYGLSGRRGKARKILEDLAELARRRYVSPYGVAAVHAGLGEKDEALRWLEKAFREHDDGLANLRIDPNWAALRAEPRFQDLVRRMRFPE